MTSAASVTLLFLSVYTLAIITPGPNFILVSTSALTESRRYGLATSLGIATGSFLFSLAGIFGLLLLVSSWSPMEIALRFCGGGYLLWIGGLMLRNANKEVPAASASLRDNRTCTDAYRRGLLTNLTNPKAWAFYLSLFTLIATPDFSLSGKLFLAFSMFIISFFWYGTVAFLMTSPAAKIFTGRVQQFVQGGLGMLLIVFAVRILLGH